MHKDHSASTTLTGNHATVAFPPPTDGKGRPRLALTDAEIEAIRLDWAAGLSINAICDRHQHGTVQIRRLAEQEGWPSRAPREPLPAGHSLTWAVLWRDPSFAGMAFSPLRAA